MNNQISEYPNILMKYKFNLDPCLPTGRLGNLVIGKFLLQRSHNVRKKCQVAGSLDFSCHVALVCGTKCSTSLWRDFATLTNIVC